MVETPELTGVDDAGGAEMMLLGLDFVLRAHQVADFVAGQAAVMSAGYDTIHLPRLTRIDLLTVCLALLVGVPDLGVTVTIPVGLRGGSHETETSQHQHAEAGCNQNGFHDVAPVRLSMHPAISLISADNCTLF